MPNVQLINRLKSEILDNLLMLDAIVDGSILQDDVRHLAEGVKSATREALNVDPGKLEEAWEVKPLHDRLKALQVTLRILRNSTDRAEDSVNRAIAAANGITAQVEEADDDDIL